MPTIRAIIIKVNLSIFLLFLKYKIKNNNIIGKYINFAICEI